MGWLVFKVFPINVNKFLNWTNWFFTPQSPRSSGLDSPDVSWEDGPIRLNPVNEESAKNELFGLLRRFYESELGALSIGLAIGGLAVFVALRIYKAGKL